MAAFWFCKEFWGKWLFWSHWYNSAQQKKSYDQKVIFGIRTLMRLDLDYCSFLVYWKAHNFFSTERNGLKFCMHDRNMLWKAHDFLAYARQPRTAQTSDHYRDARTGPCPLRVSIFQFFSIFQLFRGKALSRDYLLHSLTDWLTHRQKV